MGRKDTVNQQQQAQEPTAADERAAGLGGSYVIDHKAGTTRLAQRSEASAPVSRKAPLKRELPGGGFEEVEQLEDGTLVPLSAEVEAPATPSAFTPPPSTDAVA